MSIYTCTILDTVYSFRMRTLEVAMTPNRLLEKAVTALRWNKPSNIIPETKSCGRGAIMQYRCFGILCYVTDNNNKQHWYQL
jgi:hypothetical protein